MEFWFSYINDIVYMAEKATIMNISNGMTYGRNDGGKRPVAWHWI